MTDKPKIAIIAIAYDRPDSLRRLLASIDAAYYPSGADIPLVISIDHSGSDDTEAVARSHAWAHGEQQVVAHNARLGLKRHVLGLGRYLDEYEAIILLEDDLIVSPSFYLYATASVARYSECDEIAGISLYAPQVCPYNMKPYSPMRDGGYDCYFMMAAQSWGQIWMRRQWMAFRAWLDEKSATFEGAGLVPDCMEQWPDSSWLKWHSLYCAEKRLWFAYPYTSLTSNMGDAGTHMKRGNTLFRVPLQYGAKENYSLPAPDAGAHYDAFYENAGICAAIGIDANEACIDIGGLKGNKGRKRYWLTPEPQDYEVARRWSVALMPTDANAMLNVEGEGLYLYDTWRKQKFNGRDMRDYLHCRAHACYDGIYWLRQYGIRALLRDAWRRAAAKLGL